MFVLGALSAITVLVFNNVGGFLAYAQAEAAVAQTNAGGIEWQLMRYLTQIHNNIHNVWFVGVVSFIMSAYFAFIHIAKRMYHNNVISYKDLLDDDLTIQQEENNKKE